MTFQMETSDDSNALTTGAMTVIDDRSRILVKGKNNKVVIGDKAVLKNVRVSIVGDGLTLEIGAGVKISGLVDVNSGAHLRIGEGSTFERVHIICSGAPIEIGEDCMFAAGVELRTTDSHPIFDIASGQRINADKPIKIGDHVWSGKQVGIMKGARVGAGSIIALGSIVTGAVRECSLIGGVPARVLRSGVTWSRHKKCAQLADDRRATAYARSAEAPSPVAPAGKAEPEGAS